MTNSQQILTKYPLGSVKTLPKPLFRPSFHVHLSTKLHLMTQSFFKGTKAWEIFGSDFEFFTIL